MPEVLTALMAFVAEHQRCGDLDGGRDDGKVWLACSCGAQSAHPARAPPQAPARRPVGVHLLALRGNSYSQSLGLQICRKQRHIGPCNCPPPLRVNVGIGNAREVAPGTMQGSPGLWRVRK